MELADDEGRDGAVDEHFTFEIVAVGRAYPGYLFSSVAFAERR